MDHVRIGIPKERKLREGRVALTPEGVRALLSRKGNAPVTVFIEREAGAICGFRDPDYAQAGAEIVDSAESLWRQSSLIVKVKEPITSEHSLFQPGQIVFCFQHLEAEANRALQDAYRTYGVIPLAFEKIVSPQGKRPILAAMSRIAGRLALDLGAEYLRRDKGGKGKAIEDATVMILGAAGTAGQAAFEKALRLGVKKLIAVDRGDKKPSTPEGIAVERTAREFYAAEDSRAWVRRLPETDIVIGAVATATMDRAPVVLTRATIKTMEPGSVFVDVAIDQGGCSETSRVPEGGEFSYVEEGVVHLCIPNLPGLVPKSSTLELEQALLPYLTELVAIVAQAEPANIPSEILRRFGLCELNNN